MSVIDDLVHVLWVELVYLGRVWHRGSLKWPLELRNDPRLFSSSKTAHCVRQKCFWTARQSCWHRGSPTGSPSSITQSGKAYLQSKAWNWLRRNERMFDLKNKETYPKKNQSQHATCKKSKTRFKVEFLDIVSDHTSITHLISMFLWISCQRDRAKNHY